MIQQDPEKGVQGLVYWMGIALVGAGGLCLIYLALSLVQLMQSPGGSDLVNWVLSSAWDNGTLVSGHLNENLFEIRVSDKLQYLLLGLIGLIAIGVFAKVVGILIEGGIALIRFSVKESDNKQSKP